MIAAFTFKTGNLAPIDSALSEFFFLYFIFFIFLCFKIISWNEVERKNTYGYWRVCIFNNQNEVAYNQILLLKQDNKKKPSQPTQKTNDSQLCRRWAAKCWTQRVDVHPYAKYGRDISFNRSPWKKNYNGFCNTVLVLH